MNAVAWVVLILVGLGMCGGLAVSLMVAGRSGRAPARPVWQVMLEGGTNGPPDEPASEALAREVALPVGIGVTNRPAGRVPATEPEPGQPAGERVEESAGEQNTKL